MSISLEALIELRNRTLDAYVDGQINEDVSRADLAAIAIELDRILSPNRQGHIEGRAARVTGAILADSRARQAAVPPAKAARIEGVTVGSNASGMRNRRPMERVPVGSPNSRRQSPTRFEWRGPSLRPSETSEPSRAHPSACARLPTAQSATVSHRLAGVTRCHVDRGRSARLGGAHRRRVMPGMRASVLRRRE